MLVLIGYNERGINGKAEAVDDPDAGMIVGTKSGHFYHATALREHMRTSDKCRVTNKKLELIEDPKAARETAGLYIVSCEDGDGAVGEHNDYVHLAWTGAGKAAEKKFWDRAEFATAGSLKDYIRKKLKSKTADESLLLFYFLIFVFYAGTRSHRIHAYNPPPTSRLSGVTHCSAHSPVHSHPQYQ